jgi:polysaccharide deacetylase 2 family uncharacterized protein YibQ
MNRFIEFLDLLDDRSGRFVENAIRSGMTAIRSLRREGAKASRRGSELLSAVRGRLHADVGWTVGLAAMTLGVGVAVGAGLGAGLITLVRDGPPEPGSSVPQHAATGQVQVETPTESALDGALAVEAGSSAPGAFTARRPLSDELRSALAALPTVLSPVVPALPRESAAVTSGSVPLHPGVSPAPSKDPISRVAAALRAGRPAWRRNAVPLAAPLAPGVPLVAVVIDDLGLNVRNAARTIALPGPLTLAFMSYAGDLAAQTGTARAAGHELMVHVPMEPLDGEENPGPKALLTGLPDDENLARLRWALDRFDGYVGINNHMGSRFTRDETGMAVVMREVSARGLMFLDSRTVNGSVSGRVAARAGVPFLARDVFLDNDSDRVRVLERLDELVRVARLHGRAIGIAHPHDGTLAALEEWLPRIEGLGIRLVPVSALLDPGADGDAPGAVASGSGEAEAVPHAPPSPRW